MDALRHFYASTLLDGGGSIKALSEYLGHLDAGFTLRTCTRLLPSIQERILNTVSAVFKAATRTRWRPTDDPDVQAAPSPMA